MIFHRYRYGILSLCFVILFASCSKEKLDELVDKTKQTVSDGADKVKEGVAAVQGEAKEQLQLSGNAQLTLDAPVATSACYASFLPQGAERPSVLQLRSYREPSQLSFPSLLVQAQVRAGGISELVGQTVPAQLFFQKDKDTPILFSAPGTHVELKVNAADEKTLSAEIVGGTLRNSQTAGDQSIKGTLSAVFP